MIFRKSNDLQNTRTLPETSSLKDPSKTSIPLLAVALMGLVVAFLSGFHESIPFASSVCTSACTDTVRMHFLHIHFWVWGAAFYLCVAVLAVFSQKAVAWIAYAAAGVEALLVLLMIWMKAPCVFCIANAVVVVVLLLVAFRKDLVWQQATLALLFFLAFLFWVPFENNLPYIGPAHAAHSRYDYGAAARLGSETITNQRLDVLLGRKLQQLRTDIYRMKMQRLDRLIVNTIMDKEAKREGKTVDALVAAVTGSVSVSDADVAQYMQEHQQQLQSYENTIPNLKQRIKQGLEKEKRERAVENYAHSLEPRYHVKVLLPVPYPPKVKIDISGAPALGPENAPVTVVEFSDYQCPACRANHPVVKQVRAAFGDKLRWVHMDYPLHIHKYAFEAAEAGLCAQDQGKFWQYQDDLFTTPDLSVPNLVAMAVKLGMSGKQFSKCLKDSKYRAVVKKSIQEAVQAGIHKTPTYVINGMVFVGGPSLPAFKRVIDEVLELKKAGVRKQLAGKAR